MRISMVVKEHSCEKYVIESTRRDKFRARVIIPWVILVALTCGNAARSASRLAPFSTLRPLPRRGHQIALRLRSRSLKRG